MNTEQIYQAIETYLSGNWVASPYSFASLPQLDLSAPNQPPLYDNDQPYVVFDSELTSAITVTVPHHCTRYNGYIVADIYVKEDTGKRKAAELTDELIGLLSYQRISGGLRIKGFLNSGSVEDLNGWVIYSCQWPFETENSI